jgi:hypothetical protein
MGPNQLFGLNSRVLDPFGPLRQVLAHEGVELLGRAREGIEADRRQPLLDAGSAMIRRSSALRRSTIGLGVCAGAKTAFQGTRSSAGSMGYLNVLR